MKVAEFLDKVYEGEKEDYGIFLPPTSAQLGLKVLMEHFLGKEWYTINPISLEQVYTEAIVQILEADNKRIRRIAKNLSWQTALHCDTIS